MATLTLPTVSTLTAPANPSTTCPSASSLPHCLLFFCAAIMRVNEQHGGGVCGTLELRPPNRPLSPPP